MTALGQQRQMFANPDAVHAGSDRLELAANFRRRVGLEIEAIELRHAAGSKNIDDAPGSRPSWSRLSLGDVTGHRAESCHLIHPQPEEADCTCLQRGSSGIGGIVGALLETRTAALTGMFQWGDEHGSVLRTGGIRGGVVA